MYRVHNILIETNEIIALNRVIITNTVIRALIITKQLEIIYIRTYILAPCFILIELIITVNGLRIFMILFNMPIIIDWPTRT